MCQYVSETSTAIDAIKAEQRKGAQPCGGEGGRVKEHREDH